MDIKNCWKHQFEICFEENMKLRGALGKIRFMLADKAERIPMTNLGRDIDKIAEQALED